ncbi:MAG: glycosyltransferase [Fimbriimonadaceae bacterium]|nr:glycosyltransferase [Fimbriimonadaceae bacterium]
MNGLRIGLQLPIINTYSGNVWGDEIMAVGLADALRGEPGVAEAEVYDLDTIHDQLDLVISFYAWPETRLVAGPRQVWWYQAPRLRAEAGPVTDAVGRYEAVLVAGPNLGREVLDAGARKVLFVPMSANPEIYHPVEPRAELAHDIVFVANHNRTREEVERYLLPLLPLGLTIYGAGWDREPELAAAGCLRGRIHPADVPAVYSSSKLVLSCHTPWHRLNDVPTSRLWEATCCGACVLSDRLPTAEKLFGETLVFSQGGAELAAFAQALLADDAGRQALAHAARERVEAGLTFRHHARRILDFLRG